MRNPSHVVVVALVFLGGGAVGCSDDAENTSSSSSSSGGSSSGSTSSGGSTSSSSGASTAKAEAGQPCSKDADCATGLCATSITPKLCTKSCTSIDECPAELPVCRQVPGTNSGVCGKQ